MIYTNELCMTNELCITYTNYAIFVLVYAYITLQAVTPSVRSPRRWTSYFEAILGTSDREEKPTRWTTNDFIKDESILLQIYRKK